MRVTAREAATAAVAQVVSLGELHSQPAHKAVARTHCNRLDGWRREAADDVPFSEQRARCTEGEYHPTAAPGEQRPGSLLRICFSRQCLRLGFIGDKCIDAAQQARRQRCSGGWVEHERNLKSAGHLCSGCHGAQGDLQLGDDEICFSKEAFRLLNIFGTELVIG